MRKPLLVGANMTVADDRRKAARHMHFATARAESPDGASSGVAIIDISTDGLRAIVKKPPEIGSTVEFLIHVRRFAAVVVWAREGVIGCQFTQPIADEDMNYILARSPSIAERS
jgi:hypothetical protein